MMITYFFVFRMSQNINSIADKIRLLSILKFRINFTYHTPILCKSISPNYWLIIWMHCCESKGNRITKIFELFLYAAKGDIPKPITRSQPDWIMVGIYWTSSISLELVQINSYFRYLNSVQYPYVLNVMPLPFIAVFAFC